MMKDALLQERFERHLANLEKLAEKEMKRLWGDEKLAPVATFYRDEARRVRAVWERHERDVLANSCRRRAMAAELGDEHPVVGRVRKLERAVRAGRDPALVEVVRDPGRGCL